MVGERCLMVHLYTLDAGQVAKDRHRGMGRRRHGKCRQWVTKPLCLPLDTYPDTSTSRHHIKARFESHSQWIQ